MAEGFIRPRDDKVERLEDIGENYLDELVSRFFIEETGVEKKKRYQLHDLLHDLAERVQGDDFIRIDDSTNSREVSSHISNMSSRSENIRHIYLPASMINKLKEKICLLKNIRTFWVEADGGIVPKNVLQEILKHMEKLRVLYLFDCVDDLPDSIGKLKHLRYLSINGYQPLKKIPDSICKLYHLQMLGLPNCESLPKDFCELISLRLFDASRETLSHISHVGRLTSLQKLDHFVVRKEGYELQQLENLNQLRGKMRIAGLENVASTEDAVKANLRNKKHIKGLHFEWNSDERDTTHVELLDALQPHPHTSGLTLEGFGGDRFPNWLLSPNSLKHLRSLILMGCNKVEEISSIHESLPSCTSLILQRFKNLKKMPTFPPNLTSLEINNIPQVCYFSEDDLLKKEERNQSKHEVVKQIVKWLKPEDVPIPKRFESTVENFFVFVAHRFEGAVNDCPVLLLDDWVEILTLDPWSSREQLLDAWVKYMHCHMETMFYKNEESKLVLPSSLTYLKISSCSITDDALSSCIQCLVSLSKLKLSFIHTITSLPLKEVLHSLKHLKSLTIEGCYLLSSLGGIGALTSLIELELKDCPNLNIPNDSLPSSLERLIFRYCSNADVIHALKVSGVVNYMKLVDCPTLTYPGILEDLPRNLRQLDIKDCPTLTEKFKKGGPNFQVRFKKGDTIVTFPREEEGNHF